MDRSFIGRLNQLFGHLALLSLRYRWWVFALSLMILSACIYLSSFVRMDNGFESFFNENDRAYSAYLQYREDFGSDEIAYIVYDASEYAEGVFNLGLMQKIDALSRALEQEIPFVKEVKSISNAEVMIGVEDGMDILELQHDFPNDQASLDRFATLFMSKQLYLGGLVSEDAKFGAIQIDMTRSSTDPIDKIMYDPEGGEGLENVYPQVSESALMRVLALDEFKHIKFHVSGDVSLNSSYNRLAYGGMYTSFALCFVLIFILLLIFFKGKWIAAIGPLAVVLLTIFITVGFISLNGWNIDMMFSMVPTLLVVVGTAHSVHIISEFRLFYARYGDRARAIRETFYLVGTPCLLTSATTAAGFLALTISPIKAIEHMAVYSGFAVMAAFVLSLSLLTFILSFGRQETPESLQRQTHAPYLDALLSATANLVIKRSKWIIILALLIFSSSIVGISKIRVDSNFLLEFKPHVPVRQTTQFIDKTVGGIGSSIYLFELDQADAIKDPEFLRELEAFQQYVDQQDLVTKTYSIVDLIKDINQSFHGGDPNYYRIPESQDLVAQYLLVYELSGGDKLRNFVSDDYSRTSLEIRTRYANTSEVIALKEILDGYQASHAIGQRDNTFTGINSLWLQLVEYITESQIKGVLLAFFVITLMMCFIFQSLKVGLISMIPNIGPALLTVGLIGWLDTPLDYMKLMIAPIALGIAVDDTIHLMTRFHHEFKRLGNYAQALHATLRDVGRALIITSIVLICGFLIFCFADMDNQWWFGVLLATTIFVALLADFLVMPALVLLFKPFGPERNTDDALVELGSEADAVVDS